MLHPFQEFITIHHRHIHIQDNQGQLFPITCYYILRLKAIASQEDIIFIVQHLAEEGPVQGTVINNKYPTLVG